MASHTRPWLIGEGVIRRSVPISDSLVWRSTRVDSPLAGVLHPWIRANKRLGEGERGASEGEGEREKMEVEVSKRVVMKSTQIVVPAEPTFTPRIHPLSLLDIVLSTSFVHNVYYFAPFHSDLLMNSSHQSFESLKNSLAKVLVHFPVLAGRVRIGHEDGRLCIVCNDEGILLVEAIADARFDEWKDLRNCPLEPYLVLGDPWVTDQSTSVLLKIQVTSFHCGGIAIGFGFAHICSDGWSAAAFMKCWSEVHRGLPISMTPVFDAHLLKARSPPSVDHPVKDFTFSPKPEISCVEEGASSRGTLKRAATTFYFSSAAVNALVHEVENGPWSYERPTSFEALVALCWKTMTEARNLPEDAISTLAYPVSVRGRWDPPLPPGFYGNCAHASCVGMKAGDIKHHHVSYLAKKVRDDKDASGRAEYLRSVVDLLEIEMAQGKAVNFKADFYAGMDVEATIFTSFPVYEVDFGSGKPLHFSFYLHPLYVGNGVACFLPTPHGGRSRYVVMSMAEEHTKILSQNKLFNSMLKISQEEPDQFM